MYIALARVHVVINNRVKPNIVLIAILKISLLKGFGESRFACVESHTMPGLVFRSYTYTSWENEPVQIATTTYNCVRVCACLAH